MTRNVQALNQSCTDSCYEFKTEGAVTGYYLGTERLGSGLEQGEYFVIATDDALVDMREREGLFIYLPKGDWQADVSNPIKRQERPAFVELKSNVDIRKGKLVRIMLDFPPISSTDAYLEAMKSSHDLTRSVLADPDVFDYPSVIVLSRYFDIKDEWPDDTLAIHYRHKADSQDVLRGKAVFDGPWRERSFLFSGVAASLYLFSVPGDVVWSVLEGAGYVVYFAVNVAIVTPILRINSLLF